MSSLYPEVRDVSNLGAKYSIPYYLPIAVEGQGGSGGTASVGVVYQVNVPADADTYFVAGSSLNLLLKFLLNRGVTPIWAAASVMSPIAPTLVQRQAVWQTFESMNNIRIRLTDDVTQATLVALAQSCTNANLIYNKQVGFGGLAAGSTKSTIIGAAEAINSNRFVLVAPGILDASGVLYSGAYAAATVAAAVGTNSDISDSLNRFLLPGLGGIELGANGIPVFLRKVVSGSVVNDFNDLLAAGASPLMSDPYTAGARITHLRTTFTGSNPGASPVDTTYDALMTRLIVDQLFVDVKLYCLQNDFLRKGNTQQTRDALAAGISALLASRSAWIQPIVQPDGILGYAVTVIPSTDMRQVTVQYQGTVVRGINIINIDAELVIPA